LCSDERLHLCGDSDTPFWSRSNRWSMKSAASGVCNSNSSCSVEKRGTHTIASPSSKEAVPKKKHKDSLKKVRKRLG